MNVKIVSASWHRNGVGGEGFYSIIFDCEHGRMHASLFSEPGYCAVHDIGMLGEGNVEFARGNSWRGDHFENALRPALAEFEKANGTNRIGPFSAIPADVVDEMLGKLPKTV